jgi:glycosyltransferase involved in cell wall biosynthesis
LDPYLGNFVRRHAEAVSAFADVSVIYVCSDPGLKENVEVVTQREPGIFTVNVYYKKVSGRFPLITPLKKLLRYRKAWKTGMETVLQNGPKPHLVHAHVLWPAGMMAMSWSKRLQVPFVVTEHSTVYQPSRAHERSAAEKSYARSVAASASLIMPVSEDLKNAMQEAGLRGRYRVVNNVVDTALFHPAPLPQTGRKTRFLHVSTMVDAHKNITGMLQAIARLAAARNDFEVTFITDGNAEPHRATAQQLGLKDTVAFEGKMSIAGIAGAMRAADAFLLFSNYENMPCVIIEAFASGLPVISTDVGGISEQVKEGRGLLVPKGDVGAFAEAMDRMIASLQKGAYDREAISAYAREHFSYEKVGARFTAIYREVLGST